jgi:hypothetical protein
MFNNSSFSILVVREYCSSVFSMGFPGLGPTFRESVWTEMTTRFGNLGDLRQGKVTPGPGPESGVECVIERDQEGSEGVRRET